MNSNEKILAEFYEAFGRKDAAGMVQHYADTIHFSDPVFPDLKGERAKNMWRMLCGRSKDLKVVARDISANETTGKATWDAWYTFATTGRRVHNIIDARFEFKDGKITRHEDHFSFWRWSRQALGPIGWVLGWSPLLLNKVRKTAEKSLQAFQ